MPIHICALYEYYKDCLIFTTASLVGIVFPTDAKITLIEDYLQANPERGWIETPTFPSRQFSLTSTKLHSGT